MFKKTLIASVIAVASAVPGSLLAADAEPAAAKPDAAPAADVPASPQFHRERRLV